MLLFFCFKQFLHIDIGTLHFIPSSRPWTKPTVFSHDEALRVITHMKGVPKLAASLMYGGGLIISEAIKLRIQDIDFSNNCIVVRDGKGSKWRRTLLPASIISDLHLQIEHAIKLHD